MTNRHPANDNPLLTRNNLPHQAIPFDKIKPEHFEPAILEGIRRHKKEMEAIGTSEAPPTFDNTIGMLQTNAAVLGTALTAFYTVLGAMKTDELSAIEAKIKEPLARHSVECSMDMRVFQRVKSVYDRRDKLGLTAEQARLLEKTYAGFVGSGINLPAPQKQRMGEIQIEMAALGKQFSDNVRASTMAWSKLVTAEADLDGVSDTLKAKYAENAQKAGHPAGTFLILLEPRPTELMETCTNRALREDVSKGLRNIAYGGAHDNRPVVMQVMKLRHEMAQIMGHKTYAEMSLKRSMAQTPQAVNDFLARNLSYYKPAAEKEEKELEALAKKDGITLMPWDTAFYTAQLQKQKFNVSANDLKPYFVMDKVIGGAFAHAEKLFNISFKDAKGKYPVYDADMNVYEVHDNKNGALIGLFYTDFYARPGMKRGGAWMSSLRVNGLDGGGQMTIPHVINVCNFEKPAAGKPALISYDDVRTVFHEFGHGLHGLLSKGNYPGLNGTSVLRDWVELPSQLQENWIDRKEVLDTFAAHHDTGAKIPATLLAQFNAASNFGSARAGQRQTYLAMLDMAWHDSDPATIKSFEELEERVGKLTGTFHQAATGGMTTNFGHILGGYAAGYYVYKWAEVLDADIFETKFGKDLYNRAHADGLREKIYATGNTRHPMDLFRDYMGRNPDPDAMLRREGLLPPKQAAAKKPGTPGAQPG